MTKNNSKFPIKTPTTLNTINYSNPEPITHIPILKDCNTTPNGASPIRNDGTFIENNAPHDGFTSINTVRYGEEVDVDDL